MDEHNRLAREAVAEARRRSRYKHCAAINESEAVAAFVAALQCAEADALERAAKECDAKRAACEERRALAAQAGDVRNEEWFRARAQAAEALARDIRALAAR